MLHWFLLPVWLCGLLITPDAIHWFRRQYDTFDPRALIGLLGVHFFFLAPLLFVLWDVPMMYVRNPDDWRPWLGITAALNCSGLIIYQLSYKIKIAAIERATRTLWTIHSKRFWILLSLFVLIGIAAQMYLLSQIGGFGHLSASQPARAHLFVGKGGLLMLGEAVPILLFFALTHWRQQLTQQHAFLITVIVALTGFFFCQFFVAGLRGSRSATIVPLFWAAGIVHFLWRPLTPRLILMALIPLMSFMVVYGFYKSLGSRAVDLLSGRATLQELQAEAPERGLVRTLFTDLSRVDTQAYLVYRLLTYPDQYQVALGRTYLGAISILIPRTVWPDRPPAKVKEGTELLYGKGTFRPGVFQSSRVYGLLGETLLNFHLVGVPFAFFIFGVLLAQLRRWMDGLPPGDARWLLVPFLIHLGVVILVADMDNIVVTVVKNGFVPFFVVILSAQRVRLPHGAAS